MKRTTVMGLDRSDAGEIGKTMIGDQRAKIIGFDQETQFTVTADKPTYGTYAWGGNDALSGSSGKDDIFGDAGDDLIGGGAGSDNIRGGDGNDCRWNHQNAIKSIATCQRYILARGRFFIKHNLASCHWASRATTQAV